MGQHLTITQATVQASKEGDTKSNGNKLTEEEKRSLKSSSVSCFGLCPLERSPCKVTQLEVWEMHRKAYLSDTQQLLIFLL